MCIHRHRTGISIAYFSTIFGIFLAGQGTVAAQFPSGFRDMSEFERSTRWAEYQQLTIEQNLLPERTPQHIQGQHIVSADDLRYQISEKTRKKLLEAAETAKLGNHDEAIRQLNEILSKHRDAEPYVKSIRGTEYLELRRWDIAAQDLEEAASMLPHEPQTRSNYALALLMTRRYEQAEREARKAVDLGGETKAREILAILVERRKQQDALESLSRRSQGKVSESVSSESSSSENKSDQSAPDGTSPSHEENAPAGQESR